MRVDSHQHFWSVSRDDYGWLSPDKGSIYRDYGPADLAPLLADGNIDRTVLVQAAPTVNETEYMLGIADATKFVGKIVGWIDNEKPYHLRHLERWAKHAKFAGVRPMIQDIPDPEWMHRPDVAWSYDALNDLDLCFDALGHPIHIAPFLRLFEKYPDMRVVINHCLKPRIRDNDFDDWAAGMSRLAAETGAYCKLSGLVNQASTNWTPDELKPYADLILEAFGPDRTMFGSDWPVSTLASEYGQWLSAAESFVPDADARQKVFGGTAAKFYRIET